MSKAVAVDEKEAVLSLLGLQSARAESPSEKPVNQKKDSQNTVSPNVIRPQALEKSKIVAYSSSDDEHDPVRSPRLAAQPRGLPLRPEGLLIEDNTRQGPCLNAPKTVSPYPEANKSSGFTRYQGIGKKRKHHNVVAGQFEDADDDQDNFSISQPRSRPASFLADGASMEPSTWMWTSPPHLMTQQISNEYAHISNAMNSWTAGSNNSVDANMSNSSSVTMEERFRQFLIWQQQQQQYFTMMQHQHQQLNSKQQQEEATPGKKKLKKTASSMVGNAKSQQSMMTMHQLANLVAMNQQKQQQQARVPPASSKSAASKIPASKIPNPPAGPPNPSSKPASHPASSNSHTAAPISSTRTDTKLSRHPPAALAAISAALAAEKAEESPFVDGKNPPNKKSEECTFHMEPTKDCSFSVGNCTLVRFHKFTPPSSWNELATAPIMPPVEADVDENTRVFHPRDKDVLLGRGGLTNTHPGNVFFRDLITRHRINYNLAPKGDKGALSRFIANYIRAQGGRFLAKSKSLDGAWVEVGDDQARKKCGQGLREGSAQFNREFNRVEKELALKEKKKREGSPEIKRILQALPMSKAQRKRVKPKK